MSGNNQMLFTLWDVEHGLAIWVKTPNAHNHWIDAGRNTGTDFSPAEHVYKLGESKLDYLIISHPDKDHIGDLPEVIQYLGIPRVFCRNKDLPSYEKYGNESFEYQRTYKNLDNLYNNTVPEQTNPCNPLFNGGINIATGCLSYFEANEILNDTSVVTLYKYANWLFVCPGDIEPTGWPLLWKQYKNDFSALITNNYARVLVAPHHGRCSGYSKEMMDVIQPHLVLISDEYGQAETDPRYRTVPLGLNTKDGTLRFLSTKTSGRIQFRIFNDGSYSLSFGGNN